MSCEAASCRQAGTPLSGTLKATTGAATAVRQAAEHAAAASGQDAAVPAQERPARCSAVSGHTAEPADGAAAVAP